MKEWAPELPVLKNSPEKIEEFLNSSMWQDILVMGKYLYEVEKEVFFSPAVREEADTLECSRGRCQAFGHYLETLKTNLEQGGLEDGKRE